MGLLGAGSKNQFAIRDLADRRLKAAAELIDDHLGKTNDDSISEGGLQKAAAQLKKTDHGVFKDLGEYEIQILKDALLPSGANTGRLLSDFLATEQEKPAGPFATAIATSAIRDPAVRRCAEAIAMNFGSGEDQVNLTELRDAQQALSSGNVPDGAKGAADFTEHNIADLELFLMTGKGGLVTHEGVAIGGERFREAFPLPGDPDSPDVIKHYDTFFETCGYDLIFIKGPKPVGEEKAQLYIVLNEAGSLKVKTNMKVQLGDDANYQDLGEVVATHDINNSFGEATWGFWGDVATGLVKTIRGKLGKNLDTRLEGAADRAAKDIADGSGSDAPQDNSAMTGMLAAGAVGAGVGAAAATFVGPAVATLGVSVTGFNLIDAYKNRVGRDKSLIFHAMGVGVNQDRKIR